MRIETYSAAMAIAVDFKKKLKNRQPKTDNSNCYGYLSVL